MLYQFYSLLISGIFFGAICAVVAAFISPLQFLKVIKQQTGKSYRDIINDTLSNSGTLTFFRGVAPYSAMQFLSSMSFGFAEYISVSILHVNSLSAVVSIFIQSALGGIIETGFSIYYELKEISKNKGSLMKRRASLTSILYPALIRNIIFWHASVIAYEVTNTLSLGMIASSIIAFALGVVLGLISLPFDVIATQSCGADSEMGFIKRYSSIMRDRQFILAGGIIRVIQIGIFTLTTVISLFLFQELNF